MMFIDLGISEGWKMLAKVKQSYLRYLGSKVNTQYSNIESAVKQ